MQSLRSPQETPYNSSLPRLTPRELEIAKLLRRFATSKEIAYHLGVSKRTVDRHLENIYAKAGVHCKHQLVAWAWANGLLP